MIRPDEIHAKLRAAGVPLDNHESDLYAKVTPESERIVSEYENPARLVEGGEL